MSGMKFSLKAPTKKYGGLKVSKPIFEEEEEEKVPSSVNEALLADRMRQKSKGKIQQRLKSAMEEDPSVFEYDEVLPQLNNDRKRIAAAKKARNTSTKSKYIETLMEKAEYRKWEHERVREAQILKQIEAEKEIYGEKEVYITPKYKEHQKERKKWEEEQDRVAAAEEDVTTKDMTSFYNSNFFSRVHGEAIVEDQGKEDEQADTTKETEKVTATSTTEPISEPLSTEEESTKEEKESEDSVVPILTREEKIAAAKLRYCARKGLDVDSLDTPSK